MRFPAFNKLSKEWFKCIILIQEQNQVSFVMFHSYNKQFDQRPTYANLKKRDLKRRLHNNYRLLLFKWSFPTQKQLLLEEMI